MTVISSIGLGIPQYEIEQQSIKHMVQHLFPDEGQKVDRLLSVFDNAAIKKRQFVVNHDWFYKDHGFSEKNNLYIKNAVHYSLQAIDQCLMNRTFLTKDIPHEAIDMIIFVSSTGIATPSIEARLMNERPFRNDVVRLPLWGLGCAGGAAGLSRAFDWLLAHKNKTVLLIASELCSLTFQRHDVSKSNVVGTALFGDGTSAVLLVGEQSPYLSYLNSKQKLVIKNTSSFTEKNSESVMGWNITEQGFEVVFSKSIPALVDTLWKNHVTDFLLPLQIDSSQINTFIVHPGGRKVLEAMEQAIKIPVEKLKYSYRVLKNHGNMSSTTVLYVLKEFMKEQNQNGEMSILSALGPGFSSELLLLEWVN